MTYKHSPQEHIEHPLQESQSNHLESQRDETLKIRASAACCPQAEVSGSTQATGRRMGLPQ